MLSIKFILGCLGIGSALLLSGCGKSGSAAGIQYGKKNNLGCSQSLDATATVLSSTPLKVGDPITIGLQASYCPGYVFKVRGEGNPFTASIQVIRTYSQPQSVSETFIVEAYDPADLLTAVAADTVAVSFNVGSSGPTPTPVPSPLSCSIQRIAGAPVLALGQEMQIRVTASQAGAMGTLNGLPVPLATAVRLLPTDSQSGLYVANAQVVSGNQQAGCSATFQVPVCNHRILSVSSSSTFPGHNQVESRTTLSGLIARLEVNGIEINPLPAPPMNTVDVSTHFAPEVRVSSARVFAPNGDATSCSAQFTLAIPLTYSVKPVQNYASAFGFSSGTLNEAVVGVGSADLSGLFVTGSYRMARYDNEIFDSGMGLLAKTPRRATCSTDEVMVGRQPNFASWDVAMELIQCLRVRPELKIQNRSTVIFGWDYLAYGQCPAGKVMTGNIFHSIGVGRYGYVEMLCGELVNR